MSHKQTGVCTDKGCRAALANSRVHPHVRPAIWIMLGLVALVVAIPGCAPAATDVAVAQPGEAEAPAATPTPTGAVRQVATVDEALAVRAEEIVLALRDGDWETVASAVHPDKGVRFSPYTYVRAGPGAPEEQDRVFSANALRGLAADPTIYHWGIFDGSGKPIEMTFAEYADRFIYDVDFYLPSEIGYNKTTSRGNTINNVAEVYPQAVTVEYHVKGSDPALGGLDWRSLRLVFEPVGETWYLVGVVHDEWTI